MLNHISTRLFTCCCVCACVCMHLRPQDNSPEGFNDWAFMTTHAWDENPQGEWTLEIENVAGLNDYGKNPEFQMIFFLKTEMSY